MRSRLSRAGLVALCTLVLCPLAAAQAYDQLLPESTIFYVSVENVARTKERVQETALYGLWNDPAMKAFMEKPLQSWSDAMRKQKEEAGFNIAEVLDLVAGQAMLAVTGVDEKEEPRLVALVDIGKNADRVRELVTKAEETLLADGKVRRDEEDFAGVTIVRYSSEDDEAPPHDGPDCWFVTDNGLFGAADDSEDLKRLLVRRGEDATGSLATREIYAGTRRRFGARADFFAYLDLKNMLGAMAEAGAIDEDDQRILGALGILNVDALAMQIAIEPRAIDVQLAVPLNGPKKGLLKLFDGTPGNLVPPRFIPADAVAAGVMMLDLNALWAEAIKVANEIEPGSGMMMDGFLQMARGNIGMDVKAVLAALGDEIAYFARIPDPDQPGAQIPAPGMGMLSVPRFAMAFSVRDKDTLDREMNNMVAALGGMVNELEYLGVKIRYFDGGGTGMMPALAVLPDRFVFALHLDDVKAILNRYGKDVKGIADRPEFARAMEGLPAQRTMVDFADQARGLHQSLSMMGTVLGGMMGGPALLDPSLVPGVDVLEKYLDAAGSAFASEERLIYYRARTGLKEYEKPEATPHQPPGSDDSESGG